MEIYAATPMEAYEMGTQATESEYDVAFSELCNLCKADRFGEKAVSEFERKSENLKQYIFGYEMTKRQKERLQPETSRVGTKAEA